MNRAIEAEYLAEERMLKLARPLEGVPNHAVVSVIVGSGISVKRYEDWPSVDEEAGSELAHAVRDAFGREEIAI